MNLCKPMITGVGLSRLQAIPQSSTADLTEAIVSSLSLNHLPVLEPTVLAFDPLKFVDFRMSFLTLIDRRPIPAS